MTHWTEIKKTQRGDYSIVFEATDEDCSIADCFSSDIFDIAELEDKVEQGIYSWFILRCRVTVRGKTLGAATIGGMLYESPLAGLLDYEDDLMSEAIAEASREGALMLAALQRIAA